MDAAWLPDAGELYEKAPCGLVLADAAGAVLGVNQTLCTWLGCERTDLVGRKRIQELLTVGGRIFWQTHVQPLLKMQGSVAEVKLEMLRAGSEPLPVMVNVAEQSCGTRSILHAAIFVAEDRHKYERELLLQRRRAEDLLQQHARDEQNIAEARAQAEDRARLAEQMVGVVSHDIRNPLSVIHMTTVLLDRGLAPEQQKPAVARIARAVRQMQHLISDLLDFSQARLGRGLSIRKRPCDLQQAVAEAVAELAVAFPDNAVRHEAVGQGTVDVDPERLVQAIGNLVANSANHGDKQRPITVRSEVTDMACLLSVHNHGKPIPVDLLPRLFEPMVRGAAPGASGVGLGLFIVREIARGHGGEVRVRSDEGGTTFTIEVPGS